MRRAVVLVQADEVVDGAAVDVGQAVVVHAAGRGGGREGAGRRSGRPGTAPGTRSGGGAGHGEGGGAGAGEQARQGGEGAGEGAGRAGLGPTPGAPDKGALLYREPSLVQGVSPPDPPPPRLRLLLDD